MKKPIDPVSPSHKRPLIIRVSDDVDVAAIVEDDSQPSAIYYRSKPKVRTFPFRTVFLMVVFLGCGVLVDLFVHRSLLHVTRLLLHFAGS